MAKNSEPETTVRPHYLPVGISTVILVVTAGALALGTIPRTLLYVALVYWIVVLVLAVLSSSGIGVRK